MTTDDEEARKRRAAELHRAIEDATEGTRPPASPREFTDREAAEESAREESAEDDESA